MPEVREKSRKLVALYVLLAVVVGIASIVGATGDHLLRTIGGVFAMNCLFSAYRVVRPRPNGPSRWPDRAAIPDALRARRERRQRG